MKSLSPKVTNQLWGATQTFLLLRQWNLCHRNRLNLPEKNKRTLKLRPGGSGDNVYSTNTSKMLISLLNNTAFNHIHKQRGGNGNVLIQELYAKFAVGS